MGRSFFRKCACAFLASSIGALLIPPAIVSWLFLYPYVRDGVFPWPVSHVVSATPADVSGSEAAPLRVSITVPANRPCTWNFSPDGRLVILLDARPVLIEIRSGDGDAGSGSRAEVTQ